MLGDASWPMALMEGKQSRFSCAAIIAAYLMKTEQLSQEDAIESLRQSCEFVCPNDGFLDQLKMFEQMGFKVDHASSVYKRFHLKVLGPLSHFSLSIVRLLLLIT
ncbi:hypothetical protein MTR67_052579 [Solanum verrucosum]|uniref:protein-tyrosine-phosphatase n=1 Tax=Solanum verrucosum TaxID=315347 RepID=A0AAF1A3M4_SOLVR|nr:hypothetical protein MTR67_052579 [Solanum verrucosum]